MKKLRVALLSMTVAAAGGAAWLGLGMRAASARVESAATGPSVLVAPGRVEPLRDPVLLAFETQGRIASIDVDEGDAVVAGQALAHLDDRLPRARVAGAEADLAAARARLALAQRGPRAEDIAAARADADAAAAEAAHRGIERARSERLGATGAVTSSAVDADDAAAHVATATASAANARYRALAAGTRGEQIEEAVAAVAGASAALEAARVELDQTVLHAPTAGVILRRTAELGALVTMTAPIPVLSIADLGTLEVRAEIDEADLAGVAVGQAAYATADAFGDRHFPVRITRVTRELGRKTMRDDDPRARVDTRVLEVIARFDAPANELPLGLRMQVHLPR